MATETALARERAKRCEWCAKGYELDEVYGHPELPVHMLDSGDVPCTCPSDADLYEELAKERDELQAALEMLYDKWEDGTPCFEDPKDCAGSLGKAFDLSCEEEAHILALIPRAAREKETQNG